MTQATYTYTESAERRDRKRMAFAVSFVVGILGLTAAGVYAGLNATATGSEAVTSGTLSLTLAAGDGSSGFAQDVSSNMLPGDSVSTFVDLSSSGGADAKNLTLAVSGSPSNNLTTDATKGLAVTVTACSAAWTVDTDAQTASCSGTTSNVLSQTSVANLTGGAAGVLANTFASGSTDHYKVTTTLPDSTETTTDGTPPNDTIQGLAATLTFTFSDTQRTGKSTVA
jgi:hypothetical protein